MPMINDSHISEPMLEPIAICGMACRLPGQIDSSGKLWELLLKKGSVQTPKVPESRFNIDAHYHEDLQRPGSFNALGGYFLDGPADQFDPTFFNMTPIEAMWLDPQQRRVLEVCYEAFESAGLSLEAVAGTNTAVFVGCFTADYQQMSHRETDFRHNYVATGVDPGLISNRVGNTFDLHGPSFTINTACSSSIYALHNACNALRSRDCDAALVSGVNLVLTVDQHMNTAKLGILSPTSTCHTFDISADGYGRAEGAGALYIKRLSDAVRDGDVIRSVIRSSAVNTNGKVPGMGITHPSKKGQAAVIRKAYERAGLDPNDTAFFECHGTGTPVGDPIEVHAVSRAMNETRSRDKPLTVGAIKANIGHSEAASGIFAVMKAALMTENGVIPGTSGLKTINPEILESEWNVSVSRDTRAWPMGFDSRRVSVSSFGYGGTNGHVILEHVGALVPSYGHGIPKELAAYDSSSARPMLVLQSAHDSKTLQRNIKAHQAVVDRYFLADYAHTMNNRRAPLGFRGYAVATETSVTSDLDAAKFAMGPARKTNTDIAFVFTGQGAAWAGVGVEAMLHFPVFRESIRRLDSVLQSIEHPADFKIETELLKKPTESRITHAKYSQPILVGLEIALVDLLASWDVNPAATVGHSAGEYAAAYAAGLASAAEIIIAAYYRGYALDKHAPSGGTMLAVGVGAEDVSKIVTGLGNDVVIACENSPNSVTLSGSIEAVKTAQKLLEEQSIFNRELTTGMAYHSPAMDVVAGPMVQLTAASLRALPQSLKEWRRPQCTMISSVFDKEMSADEIGPQYWSHNLTGRVRFSEALTTLLQSPEFAEVGSLVELGPHSALSGPCKQIGDAAGRKVTHIPTFVRKQDSAARLLKTAGQLWVENYDFDLAAVNHASHPDNAGSPIKPKVLVDLPAYQWNYEAQYWAENRFSKEQRAFTHARHDVLGRRAPGFSDTCFLWSNRLRTKDLPWVQDHKLGGDIMFPAAGHLSAAIEATRQICEIRGIELGAVKLRDIVLTSALVIPENEDGIEIQVRLTETDVSVAGHPSFTFAIESYIDGKWKGHSSGKVFPLKERAAVDDSQPSAVDVTKLNRRSNGKRWYDALRQVGFDYGNSFNGLQNVRSDGKSRKASSTVKLQTTSGLMTGESRYMIHPSTVDACLQLIIISIHRGQMQNIPWGVVPVAIEEITLRALDQAGDDVVGNAVAWTTAQDVRHFDTHTKLWTPQGQLVMDVNNLRCVSYEVAVPPTRGEAPPSLPYSAITWKPDVDAPLPKLGADLESLVDSVLHKRAATDILYFGANEQTVSMLQTKVQSVSKLASVDEIPSTASNHLIVAEVTEAVGHPLKDLIERLNNAVDAKGDLVLAAGSGHSSAIQKALLASGLVFESAGDATFHVRNDVNPAQTRQITIATVGTSVEEASTLGKELEALGHNVTIHDLAKCDLKGTEALVIYDPAGNILTDGIQAYYTALQTVLLGGTPVYWQTTGVNQGARPEGGSVHGFLRVLRAEDVTAKLAVLDADISETPRSIASALSYQISTRSAGAAIVEDELWLHDQVVYCSRVGSAEETNDILAPTEQLTQKVALAAGAVYQGNAQNGSTTFAAIDDDAALAPGDVKIQVSFEKTVVDGVTVAAGVIIEKGPDVKEGAVGSSVIFTTDNSLRSIVRKPLEETVACDTDVMAEAVANVYEISKAITALEPALVAPDQFSIKTILTDDSMIQSYAQVANVYGLEFCAQTAEDVTSELIARPSLERGHREIIVADTFEPDVREVWRNMAGNRTLVVNDAPISAALDTIPFARGAQFAPASFLRTIKAGINPASVINKAVDVVKRSHAFTGDVVPASKAAEAPADAVLAYEYNRSDIEVAIATPTVTFSPDASYLLVGCLGGLGRSLTSWMADRGARNFAFISRSGADKPEAASLISSLTEAGINAEVFRGDAANQADVSRAVADITTRRPIKGVVHAAMVLNDGVFGPALSLEQFMSVMRPKVDGAKTLNKALSGCDLDFFLMTSSISATLGQPGQSAYAAANGFLDAFARTLRTQGVPAVALALPMILGVGVVAESDTLEDHIRSRGMYGVEEDEMLAGFEAAMYRPLIDSGSSPALLNMGLDPVRLADSVRSAELSNVYWWNDARLSAVREAISSVNKSSSGSNGGGKQNFVEEVQRIAGAEGEGAALAAISRHVIEKCSTILLTPVERFEVNGPSIASYGLDSMIGIELRSWLFKEFQLNIAFQELLSQSLTFSALSKVVLSTVQGA